MLLRYITDRASQSCIENVRNLPVEGRVAVIISIVPVPSLGFKISVYSAVQT